MRLLFVKHALVWPRTSGHDVHTFYMMKACASLGHEIALATVVEPQPEAVAGLPLTARFSLAEDASQAADPIPATSLQLRFRRYWGIPEARLHALRAAASLVRADAVVIVGLDVLPYFPALSGVERVWYAADEWVLHHLSMVRPGPRLVEDIRSAAVKGLYERAHRSVVDRVWVVSESDRRAMRWLAGFRHVDVLPNGVDAAFFTPAERSPQPDSAVFWGRLDFGPNIQALEWFFMRVWPLVRARVPAAAFTVIGARPGDDVRRLASAPGVTLLADVPDLRDAVRQHAVAVLPFVSGAGIKNKLLEAAAMGMPIVCTPKGASALGGRPPIAVAKSARAFAETIAALLPDAPRRLAMGAAGRRWVTEHHTWEAVARVATARLQQNRTAAPGVAVAHP